MNDDKYIEAIVRMLKNIKDSNKLKRIYKLTLYLYKKK
nr:MAG TPA: hypothetical protein [Caudoviricetes sp.]